MTEGGSKGGMRRLSRFVSATYAPGMHFAFASLWVLSLLGGLVSVESVVDTWVLDLRILLCVLTIFFGLFVFRAVDEIKDWDYDAVYNPDRPLVTGAVSRRDLVAYIAGTSILLLTINIFLSRILLIIICVDVSYGVFLVWLEKHSNRVKDSVLLNLVVTYPVNVGLSVYTYVFFLGQFGGEATLAGVLTIVAFAAAFLHWEFCRKTFWTHHAREGMRLYSNVIGASGSSGMALVFAVLATGTMIGLIKPWACSGISAVSGWLILFPLVFALLGQRRFYGIQRQESYRNKAGVMVPFGTFYLVLFYTTLIFHASVSNDVLLFVWQGRAF